MLHIFDCKREQTGPIGGHLYAAAVAGPKLDVKRMERCSRQDCSKEPLLKHSHISGPRSRCVSLLGLLLWFSPAKPSRLLTTETIRNVHTTRKSIAVRVQIANWLRRFSQTHRIFNVRLVVARPLYFELACRLHLHPTTNADTSRGIMQHKLHPSLHSCISKSMAMCCALS